MRPLFTIVAGIASLVLLAGCVAQKKKDAELKGLGKLYHNTTARFNGYFNATELYKASLEELTAQHQDDYTELLPVYPYVDVDNPKAAADKLDEAVKKVAVVVNLHRKSNYTDDCYLLAGQAYYLKQDYETAEETFRYLLDEYGEDYWKKKERKKLRKKEKKSEKKVKGSKKKAKNKKARKKKQKKKRKEREKSQKQKKKEMEKWRKKYNKAVRMRRKGKDVPLPKRPGSEEEEQREAAEEAIAQQEPEAQPEPEPPQEEEEEEDEEPRDDKSQNYFMKHKPAYQEGKLWLARTLIERDREEEALRYLRELEGDPNLFSEVMREIPPVRAYIHLKMGQLEPARKALVEAADLANRRQEKARYTYIMAQLYRRAGQPDEAYAAFQQVKRYSNDYTMEFNSRLNMALNEWLAGRGTTQEAVSNLEKMLKDEKNLEFRDQIYFTMATISLEEDNREQAIANLVNSLRVSSANPNQRAEAYLTLADLYFEAEDYVMAKNYFDSTLQVMAPTDEDYQRVSSLSKNLTEIAEAIQTVALQDSLLRISRLSDKEKRELAFRIQEEEEQARLAAIKAQAGQSGGSGRMPGRKGASLAQPSINAARPVSNTSAGASSTFFAYDPRTVRRGERDFQRKWGDRKLEDNWRRSNRSGAQLFEDDLEQEEVAATVFDEDEVDQILEGVPTTPEEVKVAEFKLQEALFKLGTLYRDRMEDNQKAVATLEELNRRFPGSNFELDSWYYLYLAHQDLGQSGKAQQYASKIQTKYSGSTYDRVIRDPAYADKLVDEKQKLTRYYDQAFAAFKAGKYQQSLQMCDGAKGKFGAQNDLQPKFALLRAMNVGKLEGRGPYKIALQDVVAKYKDTPEQKQAREMLRILGGAVATLPGGEKVDLSKFKPEKDAIHYVLVAFDGEIDLNDVKVSISDFNQEYFELQRLRIANIYLGSSSSVKDRQPIVVIRRFKNEAEAMDYYYTYQKNKDKFVSGAIPFQVLPITQNNYREVLRMKSVESYKAFFEQMYLE